MIITNETPSGTIDGSNTEFTLAQHPYSITTVTSDAVVTTDYTVDGNVLTLDTAPTTSLTVTYKAIGGQTLGELRTFLTSRVGITIETEFTPSVKNETINFARRMVLRHYSHQDLIKEADLTFTDGFAVKPSDYLRHIAEDGRTLYSDDTDYVKVNIQNFFPPFPPRFDRENVFTTFQDGFQINTDESSVDLTLRYYFQPVDMASDSDNSGIPTFLNDAVALFASSWAFADNAEFDRASFLERKAIEELSAGMTKQNMEKGRPLGEYGRRVVGRHLRLKL